LAAPVSHVKKLACRIAGKRIGSNPDRERTNGRESTRRAHLKRGKRGVALVGYIDVGIAGRYIDPYLIIAHRKERIVAIRDRGTQAARGAQLSGGIDWERPPTLRVRVSWRRIPAGKSPHIKVGTGPVDRQLSREGCPEWGRTAAERGCRQC